MPQEGGTQNLKLAQVVCRSYQLSIVVSQRAEHKGMPIQRNVYTKHSTLGYNYHILEYSNGNNANQ
jgi:hypothetical protein